jgi:hypothetical protein
MDRTSDEDEFRDCDTGCLDIVVISRRVRGRVIVAAILWYSVVVGMDVPTEISICHVGVVDVVVVSYRPPDGDSRCRRFADAIVEVKPQLPRVHRVVKNSACEGFEPFEFGPEVMERSGIDGTTQRV